MHITVSPAVLFWGTPVVLITTENEDGTYNISPMSSAWWFAHRCVLSVLAMSQTTQNMLRSKKCVLNFPSEDMTSHISLLSRTTGIDPVPPFKASLEYKYVKDKFGVTWSDVVAQGADTDAVKKQIPPWSLGSE